MRHTIWRASRGLAQLSGLIGLLAGLAPDRALSQEPILAGTVLSGTLSFDGHATVGDFTGTTTAVTGEISGGSALASVRGWVEAPVRSLATGKGKRDADLNKSMESDKYPVIRYELDSITPESSVDGEAKVILHGRFLIHGVTREADLPARVQVGSSGARVWAETPLSLKDYHIGGLSKMLGILKMHDEIQVHVDVTFAMTPTTPGEGE
ncbi:MAG TPA: YceI family protein [Gemmatimonadales bacterium]|nr:YceI family protein [Gemmatimonadales bacterium]